MLKSKWVVFTALAALTSVAATGPAFAGEAANKKTAIAFQNTVFNEHKVAEGFNKYVGPKYIQHNPNVPDGKDAAVAGLTRVVTELFPNFKFELKRAIAGGDFVVLHGRMSRGKGADGKDTVDRAEMDIYRFENGKIVEHWDVLEDVVENPKNDNTMF